MKNYKKDIINHIYFKCPIVVEETQFLFALLFLGGFFLIPNLMHQKLPNELDYTIPITGFLLISFLITFFYGDSLERKMIIGLKI